MLTESFLYIYIYIYFFFLLIKKKKKKLLILPLWLVQNCNNLLLFNCWGETLYMCEYIYAWMVGSASFQELHFISKWVFIPAGPCATIVYARWCAFTTFFWNWCHYTSFSKHGTCRGWQEHSCNICIRCDAVLCCFSNWNTWGGKSFSISIS